MRTQIVGSVHLIVQVQRMRDGVRRVTSIAKDNVLKGCIMFQRIFHRVIGDYPELVPDTAIVDAFIASVTMTASP